MSQRKVLPGENSGASSAVGKSKEPAIASVKRGRGRPPKIQGLQATKKDPCCVCLQKFNEKDETLFCSGRCQKFVHRHCACVSQQAFKELCAEDAEQFLCYCCFKAQKDEQVKSLMSTVEILKAEIDALKACFRPPAESDAGRVHSGPPSVLDGGRNVRSSYSFVVKSGVSPTVPSVPKISANIIPSTSSNYERKYNVVLYGLDECPSGLTRSGRLESDLTNISNIFSELDSSIQPQSISDCYRLGKYLRDASRPRPILVKFVRVADISRIFANRRKLPTAISVKPDMSSAERKKHSILMQERWDLIQSGVLRKDIKIRGDSLYVSNKKYGCVLNSKFELCSNSIQSSSLCGFTSTSQQDQLPVFTVHTSPVIPSTTSLVSPCMQNTPVGGSDADSIPHLVTPITSEIPSNVNSFPQS